MAFEQLRTIVITAIPKPRSRERFRKIAETIPTPRKLAFRKLSQRSAYGSQVAIRTLLCPRIVQDLTG